MVDAKIVEEWISKADEDFEFAFLNLNEGKTFFAQICFHFQQASEKYLKAYIIAHELEFRKIHDLTVLLKICFQKTLPWSNYVKIVNIWLLSMWTQDIQSTGQRIFPFKKLKRPVNQHHESVPS